MVDRAGITLGPGQVRVSDRAVDCVIDRRRAIGVALDNDRNCIRSMLLQLGLRQPGDATEGGYQDAGSGPRAGRKFLDQFPAAWVPHIDRE